MVLLSLLYQQAALAAYACSMDRAPAAGAAMAAHCAGMQPPPGPDNQALCEKHCSPDRSTLAEHLVLSVPALTVAPIRFPAASPAPASAPGDEIAFARSDPPPRLRYCSLLI